MKKRIHFFFHRIYLLSIIIFLLLLLPIATISIIKLLPEIVKKSSSQFQIFQEELKINNKNSSSEIVYKDSIIKAFTIANSKDQKIILKENKVLFEKFFTKEKVAKINSSLDSLNNKFQIIKDNEELEIKYNSKKENNGYLFVVTLILSFILYVVIYLYILQFKRYFKLQFKNLPISNKLEKFVRKNLIRTPLLMTFVFVLPALLVNWMLLNVIYFQKSDFFSNTNYSNQLFAISIIATILISIFIFIWQRHRINNYYLENIFSNNELKKQIFKFKASKIKDRMIISSLITSILPLIIVFMYIGLSFSYINEPEKLTKSEKKILVGSYFEIINKVDSKETELLDKIIDAFINDDGKVVYVNIIDRWLMLIGITTSIIVVFFYIYLFVKWNTLAIIKPVKDLLSAVQKTGEDAMFAHFSVVRNNDEIGELTEEFNKMSAKLKDYIISISALKNTYFKFVPKQFLDQLYENNTFDIHPGDSVEKVLTIMFADIRGFATISENLTPKENFLFINDFLGSLEPLIQKHNGFVDKYSGDSIMALFPENPEYALRAAEDMFRKVDELNRKQKTAVKEPVGIGIGINTGKVMLGIVGSQERVNATVISDSVNTAFRLEALTRKYETNMILGEESFNRLPQTIDFQFRELDIVIVKGKNKPVKIYENLDVLDKERRDKIIEIKNDFITGRELFFEQKFVEAENLFNSIYKKSGDMASFVYKERCNYLIKNPNYENFDGIVKFKTK